MSRSRPKQHCVWVWSKLTNGKVITEKQNFVKEQCWISRASEGQGHDATFVVKSSWPKQHCVWVRSKPID